MPHHSASLGATWWRWQSARVEVKSTLQASAIQLAGADVEVGPESMGWADHLSEPRALAEGEAKIPRVQLAFWGH